MITIHLNNEDLTIADNTSLSELVQIRDLKQSNVAIAINGKVVAKTQWAATLLNTGDDVLIIKASYGG